MATYVALDVAEEDSLIVYALDDAYVRRLKAQADLTDERRVSVLLDVGSDTPRYAAALAVAQAAKAAYDAASPFLESPSYPTVHPQRDYMLRVEDEIILVQYAASGRVFVGRAELGTSRARHLAGTPITVFSLPTGGGGGGGGGGGSNVDADNRRGAESGLAPSAIATLVTRAAGTSKLRGFVVAGSTDAEAWVEVDGVPLDGIRARHSRVLPAQVVLPNPEAYADPGATVTLRVQNMGSVAGDFEGTLLGEAGS